MQAYTVIYRMKGEYGQRGMIAHSGVEERRGPWMMKLAELPIEGSKEGRS